MRIEQDYPRATAHPHHRVGLLAVSLIISIFLAACSSDAKSSIPSAVSPATGPSDIANQDIPGTEEFGMTKKELVQNIETIESLIAACMNDAGFEYVAADYRTTRQAMLADKSLPGLSEKQFFAQYGYGISTLYTGLDPQLADRTTPARIGLGQENLRIFNSLSSADQVAYNHTLFGEHTDATFAVTLESEDFSRTGGCTRAAIEQVFTPEQLTVSYYNPLDALVDQDPRMIAALEDWRNCMHKAGFDYNTPEDTEPAIKERLEAITNGAAVETLPADAQAALVELEGEERAVAVADYNCALEYVEPVALKVERDLLKGSQ